MPLPVGATFIASGLVVPTSHGKQTRFDFAGRCDCSRGSWDAEESTGGGFILFKPSGGRWPFPANSPAGLAFLCFMPKPVGRCGAPALPGAAAEMPAWEPPGETHPKGNVGPTKGVHAAHLLPGPSQPGLLGGNDWNVEAGASSEAGPPLLCT